MTPATLNFDILRNQPFVDTIRFRGLDFTGATMAMHFRQYRAATGDPLIGLANATAGLEGLSVVVTEEDGITISIVTIQIDKTTVNATLPWPANGQKANTDVTTYHDLKITGGGLPEMRWVQGIAPIREGVTP